MSPSIARHCPHCKKYAQLEVGEGKTILCPHCTQVWGEIESLKDIFEQCPICQCRQFYLSKDFNQALGCLVIVIGIILVPLTYGLSLPVFALVDWLLFQRVKTTTVCYQCGSEFREFQTQKRFKSFKHHIGLKYDKKRAAHEI